MAGEALSNGTIVRVQDTAGPPITYIEVGGIQSIQTPSPERTEIDVTALDSEGQETIGGFPDYGQSDFTMFLRSESGDLAEGQDRLQELADSGDVVSFQIVSPAAFNKTYTTLGWVRMFRMTAVAGEAYQAEVSIRWTGKPTVTETA